MERSYPGTYWEISTLPSVTEGGSASIGAMIGMARKGEWHRKRRITSYNVDFVERYGGKDFSLLNPQLGYNAEAFFTNGGKVLDIIRVVPADARHASGSITYPSAAAAAFTAYAATPGTWGNTLGLRTAKFLTTVATDLTVSPLVVGTTSVTLASVTGLEIGDVLFFVKGTDIMFGIVKTINTTTKVVTFRALYTRAPTTTINTNTCVAGSSTTHKAKTRLAENIVGSTAITELSLVSASGIGAGSVVLVVPANGASSEAEFLVTRVEGNTVYFASTSPTSSITTAESHQAVTMDFNVLEYEAGVLKKEHTYLSMQPSSADYIQTRLGWNTTGGFDVPGVGDFPVPHDQNQSNRIMLKRNVATTLAITGVPIMYLGAGTFNFSSIMDTFTAADTAKIEFTVTDGTVGAPTPHTVTVEATRARYAGVGGQSWVIVTAATRPLLYTVDGVTRTINVPNTLNTQDLWLEYVNERLIDCSFVVNGANVDLLGTRYGLGAVVEVAAGTHADVLASMGIAIGASAPATGDTANMIAVTRQEIVTVIDSDAGSVDATDMTVTIKVEGATAGADRIIKITDPVAFAGVSVILGGVSGTTYYGGVASYWSILPIPTLKTSCTGGVDGVAEPGHGSGANTYRGSSVVPKSGMYLLDDVKDVAFWAIPGAYGAAVATPTTSQSAIDYGDLRSDMTFICGMPSSIRDPDAASDYRENKLFRNSHEMELVWPWRKIIDSDGINVREISPEGYVMAEFAIAALNVGPAAAPANRFEERGPFDLVYNCTDTEHGLLNPIGVCVARKYPEAGIRHMGARTLWRQEDGLHLVTVINGLHWLRKEADKRLMPQLFVSGSINEDTYSVVRNIFSNLCEILWNQGAFGLPKQQAYIVKCDDTTTSPTEKAALTVHLELTLNQFGLFMEKLVASILISPSGVSISTT